MINNNICYHQFALVASLNAYRWLNQHLITYVQWLTQAIILCLVNLLTLFYANLTNQHHLGTFINIKKKKRYIRLTTKSLRIVLKAFIWSLNRKPQRSSTQMKVLIRYTQILWELRHNVRDAIAFSLKILATQVFER